MHNNLVNMGYCFVEKAILNKRMALYNDTDHAFYSSTHLKKVTTSGHETEVCAKLTRKMYNANKWVGFSLFQYLIL